MVEAPCKLFSVAIPLPAYILMTEIPPVREPVLLSSVIAVPDVIQLIEIAGPLAAVIVPELLSVPRAGLLIIPFRRIWPRMLPVLVSVLSVRLL